MIDINEYKLFNSCLLVMYLDIRYETGELSEIQNFSRLIILMLLEM